MEAIPEEQVVPEPPQVSAPVQDEETLPLDAPAVMAASLRERWSALQRPTYHTRSAKEMAISGRLHSADSEHGTELGTVLHILLEVAMSDPSQDLSSLAKKELDANDLDMKLSDDLVQSVEAVTRSDLWGRARTSAACHHEVPYQLLEDDDGGTIVRGVIDLVFREATGWVIVDYKTDDRNTPIDALVEHYSAQVRDYARAWALLTGEPVAEAGLYFVHTNTYRTIQN